MSVNKQVILLRMISLSNNSQLTNQAAQAIMNLSPEDQLLVGQWLFHAEKEQQFKISQASKKNRY
ncbi:MAG TPA: hypothetical protein VMX17_01065 [Candidatus Glassbacteria bacterium]|nr:hypothetical protein [Candidatus Glassbacteria bacterium]